MKISKILSLLALATLASLIMISCSEDDDTVDPTTEKPAAPKNLRATSIDDSKVRLTWDASTDEDNTLFQSYSLMIESSDASESFASVNINKENKPYTVDGLTEGNIYTFKLISKYSDGEVSEDTAMVKWSPATRFMQNPYDAPIKVYSTDSDFGSGLDLFDFGLKGATSLTIGNSKDWDLGLYTSDGTITFGSAIELPYSFGNNTPAVTNISSNMFLVNVPANPDYTKYSPLNDVFDSEALDSKGTFSSQTIDLSKSDLIGKNLVIVVRKFEPGFTDYNYAKVAVLWNKADNSFLWSEGSETFLWVHVSYQQVPDVPYASVEKK